MTTSRALDLALFVGAPGNVGDGVTVDQLGPPFSASFKPVVTSSSPGVTLGKSVPSPVQQDQILVSGPGPSYAWALTTNPAVGATVPRPTAINHVLLSDATPSWTETPAINLVAAGGGVLENGGGTFDSSSNLLFTAAGALTVRVDGGNPDMSAIDNFCIDCGTF